MSNGAEAIQNRSQKIVGLTFRIRTDFRFGPSAVPDRRGPWIPTFSGKAICPLDIHVEDYDLLDAAHSLATSSRWGGHAIIPQRTAAHTIGVSFVLEALTGDKMAAYMGLHHDDAEYAFPDILSPVKHSNPIFKAIEEPIERAFFTALGIPEEYWDLEIVKHVDKCLASDEYADSLPIPPAAARASTYYRLGVGAFDDGKSDYRRLENLWLTRHFDLAIALQLASENDRIATFERLDRVYAERAAKTELDKASCFAFDELRIGNEDKIAMAKQAARFFFNTTTIQRKNTAVQEADTFADGPKFRPPARRFHRP